MSGFIAAYGFVEENEKPVKINIYLNAAYPICDISQQTNTVKYYKEKSECIASCRNKKNGLIYTDTKLQPICTETGDGF